MLKHFIGLTLLGLTVGTVWAYAQTQTVDSATPAQTVTQTPVAQSASPAVEPSAEAQPRWQSPEIWRLPPVVSAQAVSPDGVAPYQPPALNLPPVETIPLPSAATPIANAPASLSGVLSLERPIEIKPPEDKSDRLWDGSFTLGLDGSEGNSETLNFRFGFHASRKTEADILTIGIDYNKQTAETVSEVNRLFFDGRNEWLIKNTRWSWFIHETIEYDEFQSFNVRDTSDIGMGYRFIKNDASTLIGRLGGGFSHEFGGPDDGEVTPEMVVGMQFEHKISKRQKIIGAVEYAPEVCDFLRYRIRSQAALDVLLDEERNLSLRVGVLDRYTSQPNGARPNDLDYAMMLLWKF